MGDAIFFKSLDPNFGDGKISIKSEDSHRTYFKSHMGMHLYEKMPFRLRNAPETFERALNIILSGVRLKICQIKLDDVILFSPSVEVHITR